MKKRASDATNEWLSKFTTEFTSAAFVIDPFEIKGVDALVVTHIHSDHLDINTAAAVMQNTNEDVPFIGPQEVVNTWKKWVCLKNAVSSLSRVIPFK